MLFLFFGITTTTTFMYCVLVDLHIDGKIKIKLYFLLKHTTHASKNLQANLCSLFTLHPTAHNILMLICSDYCKEKGQKLFQNNEWWNNGIVALIQLLNVFFLENIPLDMFLFQEQIVKLVIFFAFQCNSMRRI